MHFYNPDFLTYKATLLDLNPHFFANPDEYKQNLAQCFIGVIEEADEVEEAVSHEEFVDELGDFIAYLTLCYAFLENLGAIAEPCEDSVTGFGQAAGHIKRILRGDNKKPYAQMSFNEICLLLNYAYEMAENHSSFHEVLKVNTKKIQERVNTVGFVKD